jgi:carotenoid 9,10(9',10')-cleavage dioxygenase 1
MPAKPDKLLLSQMGNTALQWHNGKLLALMEGSFPFLLRLCGGAIKSISAFTFSGGLDHAFTAHPKVDPKSGEMLSFVYRYVPSCR